MFSGLLPTCLCKKAFLFVLLCGTLSHTVEAAFELNFLPAPGADFLRGGYINSGQPFSCPAPGDFTASDCDIGVQADPDDVTIFRNERIGNYWHMVVIDPNHDFAMEVYTEITNLFLSHSGGHEPVFFVFNGNLEQWSGNGWDPLEINHKTFGPDNVSFSGNGTGDPTRSIIRQVLGPGTLLPGEERVRAWECDPGAFCQEFLKAEFLTKPKITQQLADSDYSSYFEIDMSHIDYATPDAPVVMINTQTIADPLMPDSDVFSPFAAMPDSHVFDAAVNSQDAHLTAGGYTYTPGIGHYNDGDGDRFFAFDPGSYDYAEGGVDFYHAEQRWADYFDPGQNTYPGNESKCAALNLDACNNPPVDY